MSRATKRKTMKIKIGKRRDRKLEVTGKVKEGRGEVPALFGPQLETESTCEE